MWEQKAGDKMTRDAFSKCHPMVNFIFFAAAMCFGVFIMHPIYLAVALLISGIYYIILNGKNGWKRICMLGVLYVFLMVINPLLNTQGENVLFYIGNRPYTLEALYYGAAIAAVFVIMILWFGCYNIVMTGDKLMSLLEGRMPSVSMIIAMVGRMIPNFKDRIEQILAARRCIGMDKGKISTGVITVEVLASWSLETGIITGDSMRARGYGKRRRTSYMIYKMKASDKVLLILMILMIGIVAGFVCRGSTEVNFVPQFSQREIVGFDVMGIIIYTVFLLIPVILNAKEAVSWSISRRKI